MELKYKGKYDKNTVSRVLNMLDGNLQIREISKITGVPETTIRNWKFGYSNLYGNNKKLNKEYKKEIIELLNSGLPIYKISRELKINYNEVRLFLKKELSKKEYSFIRASNRMLQDRSKKLTPELSYIIGVMYGDGHFDSKDSAAQIRLGAKDKDFVDYFSDILYIWSRKQPSRSILVKNNKPYYECYLCFKDAAIFLKNFLGNRKEIPGPIYDINNKKNIIMFVKGFCDSEGTFFSGKYSGTLKISNQKYYVLNQTKILMEKLGFDSKKLRIVFDKKSANGNVYVLKIHYKCQLYLFNKIIGFTIQRKQHRLEKFLKIEKL